MYVDMDSNLMFLHRASAFSRRNSLSIFATLLAVQKRPATLFSENACESTGFAVNPECME